MPYALGLMALLALLSILLVPAALAVLKRIVNHPLEMSSIAVAVSSSRRHWLHSGQAWSSERCYLQLPCALGASSIASRGFS